jgi:hypothetical protein
MTKHTPEPWGIGLNPTIPEGQQIEAFSEDGNRVLQVIVRTFNPDDLHLIAAAPDLLNALRMVLDDSGAVDWLGVRTYEVACAASAKATGEKA